jgi:glycosyltransferase involved in cell wall biosynthesis
MKKRKNLTLIRTSGFEDFNIGKDTFLVPYYMGKLFEMNVTIVYPRTRTNKNIYNTIKNDGRNENIILKPILNIFSGKNPYINELLFIIYAILYARKIDVLMRFFIDPVTVIICSLYKIINPSGFCYIKADTVIPEKWMEQANYNEKNVAHIIKRKIYQFFTKKLDLITVETEQIYNLLCSPNTFFPDIEKKTRLMYNGFDEEKFLQYDMIIKNFAQKDRVIITVSRLGSKPKNTEMFLEALKSVVLQDWKVVLIGPIEQEECNFQLYIDAYFKRNQKLKEKILFTGIVSDKKILWEWYNCAKIFVLPSRWEGFAIVLPEACRFGNYIIATDVGGVREILKYGYGEIIPQDDALALSSCLNMAIHDVSLLERKYNSVHWKPSCLAWERIIYDVMKDFFRNERRRENENE